MTVRIFFTGATGYIGGAVLGTLYAKIQDRTYSVTALVRSEIKALPLQKAGVHTVIGSLDDFDTVAAETAKADVVIHTASDEHIPAIQAIAAGARKRLDAGAKPTILIHTSGCGFAVDDKFGVFDPDRIVYDDTDVEQLKSIPDTVPHRRCELEVLRNSLDSTFKGYIISPAVVFGVSTRALPQASNLLGFLSKLKVNDALKSSPKQVRSYGPGLNKWNLVHINDLADLYIQLLVAALDNEVPTGWEGVYFAENGLFEYRTWNEAYAKALYARKIVDTPEVKPFGEEALEFPWGQMVAGNSLVKGKRARALLGWEPAYSHDDMMREAEKEVDVILADM